jgi:fructosamine-3-kinase
VSIWLDENGYGQLLSRAPVGGGCINQGARLQTTSGQSFFLKTNPHAPADMFLREAEGLAVLRQAAALDFRDGLYLPLPFLSGPDFLLLEDLTPAPRQPDYWSRLGRGLAGLHQQTSPTFGFTHDNYIGSTPQPNDRVADGWNFFGHQRLIYQGKLAFDRGYLDRKALDQLNRLARRLPELVPAQTASLLHGDLWSGNVIADGLGNPALIDPAAHYGWAEAELAMTALFGGFNPVFYHAYQEVRPLEPGFWQRFPVYNLYHLLNHLNLFGTGYLGQVLRILDLVSR